MRSIAGGTSEGPENLANANRLRESQPEGIEQDERRWACNGGDEVAHADSARCQGYRDRTKRRRAQYAMLGLSSWWQSEPDVGGVANELADGLDFFGSDR